LGFLAEPGTAERRVAARVCRAAETDLVPRPRVRVEGREHGAHDDAPGALHVQPFPRRAAELAVGEVLDDVLLQVERRRGEGRSAPFAARRLVETRGDEP